MWNEYTKTGQLERLVEVVEAKSKQVQSRPEFPHPVKQSVMALGIFHLGC